MPFQAYPYVKVHLYEQVIETKKITEILHILRGINFLLLTLIPIKWTSP